MAVGKHVTLATELEKDILAGKYGWEGGLPSASELAQQYSMSINTVKSSLSLLEGKNLIEKRGIGYYVNHVHVVMTQHVAPAHIRLPRGGYCKNIGQVERVRLPEHLAEKLHFTPSEPVVYRVQVSGEIVEGKERPYQISYRYHLMPISDEKLQKMQEATYEPLWSDPDFAIELLSRDELVPRLATAEERNLLNLPENTAISSIFECIGKDGTLLMAQDLVVSPNTTLIFEFLFTNRP